jgi:REP-associated tyrosine transposase
MRPRRLADASYIGRQVYFLTICTFARRDCFNDAALVQAVRSQFARTAEANGFDVLAYCFMPDHLHLLAEGIRAEADLRVFVAGAKRIAAHAARPFMRGRLWQPGYYDRILRDRDDAYEIIRYILENPARARLPEAQSKYPFVGGSKVTGSTSAV